MQILSQNFVLSQNVKNINKNQVQSSSLIPNFKASKPKILDSFAKEISGSIKLDGALVKEILDNPKKKALFFEMLGASILATVTNLVNLLSDEKPEQQPRPQDVVQVGTPVVASHKQAVDVNKSEKMMTLSDGVKFDVTKGVAPQVEKDFINFVNTNFVDDQITSDRLKLLFNKFAAHNRKDSHVFNNEVVSNKELLKLILEELNSANGKPKSINRIIDKYQGLGRIEASLVPSKKTVKKVEVDVSDEINDILNRYSSIKTKYYELMNTSSNKKEAKEKLMPIDQFLLASTDEKASEYLKRTLKTINKSYSDFLQEIVIIYNEIDDAKKEDLCILLQNKDITKGAIENWDEYKDILNIDFLFYNEFVNAKMDLAQMQSLAQMLSNNEINSIKISPEASQMILSMPNRKSLTQILSGVKNVFELVTGKTVTLRASDDFKYNEDLLNDELKKDLLVNGSTTYPNVVRYLYGSNYKIYNEKSFENNKIDYRLNFLLDTVNDEYIFNPKLFAPHAKLRFIERFVLNEDLNNRSLKSVCKNNMKHVLNALISEQATGATISEYKTAGGYVGVKIKIPTQNFNTVEITLDDQSKIHTIF